MGPAKRLLLASALVLLAATTSSCTASLELDRFRSDVGEDQVTAPISVNYFHLRFSAKSMQSHLNEYFELRIVDRQNAVQAKAIYNDVKDADFAFDLEKVIPKLGGPYRLDFWADHNFTARYDGIQGGINEKDHAWRRVLSDPLPEDMRLTGARYELEFLHNTSFVDVFTDLEGKPISGDDTLLPCDLKVLGTERFVDKTVELRVVEKASGRLVAFYRQGRSKPEFHALIPGVLDEETPYEVSLFVDDNGSGKYDAGEPSWKIDFTSGDTGATVDFDTNALAQTPLVFGDESTTGDARPQ